MTKRKEPINIGFVVISIIIAIAIWVYVKQEKEAEDKSGTTSVYLKRQGGNTHGKNNHDR